MRECNMGEVISHFPYSRSRAEPIFPSDVCRLQITMVRKYHGKNECSSSSRRGCERSVGLEDRLCPLPFQRRTRSTPALLVTSCKRCRSASGRLPDRGDF